MEIRLTCQYEDRIAVLSFAFAKVSGRDVDTLVQINLGGVALNFPCTFTGSDLLDFAEALGRMHTTLSGGAQLASFGEEAAIDFAVENSAKGTVSIRGRLRRIYSGTSGNILLGRDPTDAGIDIRFGGLLIDQSYLPDVERSIRRFLDDESVSTASIWAEDS